MLTAEQLGWSDETPEDQEPERGTSDRLIDFGQLFGMLLDYAPAVILVVAFGCALTLAYLRSVPVRYPATASIVLDIRQMLSVNDRLDPTIGIPKDSLLVTQIALIDSETNLLTVVDRLRLEDEPAFAGVRPEGDELPLFGLAAPLLHGLGWRMGEELEDERHRRRLAIVHDIQRFLLVERIDQTYVIRIRYMATDPKLGATITNAIAERYLTDQLTARYDATLRQSTWLDRRLEDLRGQARQAALEVEDYRRDAGILSSAGRTLSDRDLGQISFAVGQALVTVADDEARLKRIQAIIETGNISGGVSDSSVDPTIIRLRKLYAEQMSTLTQVRAGLAAASASAGSDVASGSDGDMERQLSTLREQTRGELRRIADRYETALRDATSRLDDLQTRLRSAKTTYVSEEGRAVKLRELERSAAVENEAYGNFLRGFLQLSQKSPFPTSEARLLSVATPSDAAEYPAKSLTLVNALAASIVAGIGLVALHAQLRPRIRRRKDVETVLGLDCLGVLDRPNAGRTFADSLAASPEFDQMGSGILGLAASRGDRGAAVVVAVMSALPEAGKHGLAASLAEVAGRGERKALLFHVVESGGIDLAVQESRSNSVGSVDYLSHDFAAPQPEGRTGREQFELVLRIARQVYDVVIVDAPSLSSRAEAAVVQDKVDAIVLCVAWGARYGGMMTKLIGGIEPPDKVLGAIVHGARPHRLIRLLRWLTALPKRNWNLSWMPLQSSPRP